MFINAEQQFYGYRQDIKNNIVSIRRYDRKVIYIQEKY